MYTNKAIIIGNLTRDPEKKALPSGMSTTSFAVAVNRTWRDKDGKKQEQTEYINCVVFGRTADTIAQYFKKGDQIYVEGRIQTRSWDDRDGKKQYKTEVVVEEFQFGNKRTPKPSEPRPEESGGYGNGVDNFGSIDYPSDDINPEDVPF